MANPSGFFAKYWQRRHYLVSGEFQWKYTLFFASSVAMAFGISGGPVFYFLNQNYDFFAELAFNQAPDLVVQLEREKMWLLFIVSMAFAGSMTFCLIYGLRITSRMIGPLMVLRTHLKEIAKGRWSTPEIRIRDGDEFHELINTYNYFYRTLKAHTKNEITKLETLRSPAWTAQQTQTWQELIAEKKSRILSTYDPAADFSTSRDLPRVS